MTSYSKNKVEAAIISRILPTVVCCAEQIGEIAGSLSREESVCLGLVSGKRHREFAAGRTCARDALKMLGVSQTSVLSGPNRQPLWPVGTIGSITHCDRYCAAVVASDISLLSVGIDAEKNEPLPPEVLEMISLEQELRWLKNFSNTNICWDRVLFSVKESVFKAWYPIVGRWLDCDSALVRIEPDTNLFQVQILAHSPPNCTGWPSVLEGRYLIYGEHIITAVVVPRNVRDHITK